MYYIMAVLQKGITYVGSCHELSLTISYTSARFLDIQIDMFFIHMRILDPTLAQT